MNRHAFPSPAFAAVFLGLVFFLGGTPVDARDDHRAGASAPRMAILTPLDGVVLNAADLRVQVLVTLAGRRAVGRVEISLDGSVVDAFEMGKCGLQAMIDSRLDLTGLSAGPHSFTVTALGSRRRAGAGASASSTFTLDRTLPLAEVNRVEEAATPKPFAGLSVGKSRHSRLDIRGRIALGRQSDGIDLSQDRVIIALGSSLTVLEPSMLSCEGTGPSTGRCRFEDLSQPLVQQVELGQGRDGTWSFRIRGEALPPGSQRFYLRIGNDWGGTDLGTGELLVTWPTDLDTSHQAQATIGSDGGTVQATDTNGVVIRLDIPPGALTRDTEITMTPLLTSPLPDSSAALHPGVRFAPEGLVFATPATLTLDFFATGQTITEADFVFLVTSPLTALPLPGTADPVTSTLTASLHHFSTTQGGEGASAYSDLTAWADQVLFTTDNLTLSDLAGLLQLAAQQMLLGCTERCIDVGVLADRAGESVAALVAEICPAGGEPNASDETLTWLLQLEALAQGLGADFSTIRPCMEQVLRALIQSAGSAAAADPALASLQRMGDLKSIAQRWGFNDLERLVLIESVAGARAAISRYRSACQANPQAPATEIAKELARLWVIFVTQDPTVDPTLAGDLQRVIDECGSDMTATVLPGTSLESCCPFQRTGIDAPAQLPVLYTLAADPPARTTLSVTKPEPNVVVGEESQTGRGFAYVLLDLNFSKAGRLDIQIESDFPSYEDYSVRDVTGGQTLIRWNLGQRAASVDVAQSGTLRFGVEIDTNVVSGSGRFTFSFTPR